MHTCYDAPYLSMLGNAKLSVRRKSSKRRSSQHQKLVSAMVGGGKVQEVEYGSSPTEGVYMNAFGIMHVQHRPYLDTLR